MLTKTAEFVSPKHPDKICDFIADSILDAYLEKDFQSRCAIEVMGGHNLIIINGEVNSKAKIDIVKLVKNIVGINYKVITNIKKQSFEIARGVDQGGAGDQGIMKGYATQETKNFMPLEYEIARTLCQKIYQKYPYDGKVQITLENKKISAVIVSFQNTKNKILLPLVQNILKKHFKQFLNSKTQFLLNQAGEWNLGGFEADTGLSGRKLIIDNYGPEIPIGGGSFSGKDYTKVDRSGAYMARKIAVDLLKKNKAREVFVKLAYAIGKAEPVMAVALIDGQEIKITGYNLSPKGIYNLLQLDKIKFQKTAQWGHFGLDFNWDQ